MCDHRGLKTIAVTHSKLYEKKHPDVSQTTSPIPSGVQARFSACLSPENMMFLLLSNMQHHSNCFTPQGKWKLRAPGFVILHNKPLPPRPQRSWGVFRSPVHSLLRCRGDGQMETKRMDADWVKAVDCSFEELPLIPPNQRSGVFIKHGGSLRAAWVAEWLQKPSGGVSRQEKADRFAVGCWLNYGRRPCCCSYVSLCLRKCLARQMELILFQRSIVMYVSSQLKSY